MEGGGLVNMQFEYHHFPPITKKMIRSPDDAADLTDLEPVTPVTPGTPGVHPGVLPGVHPGVLFVFVTRALFYFMYFGHPSRVSRLHAHPHTVDWTRVERRGEEKRGEEGRGPEGSAHERKESERRRGTCVCVCIVCVL